MKKNCEVEKKKYRKYEYVDVSRYIVALHFKDSKPSAYFWQGTVDGYIDFANEHAPKDNPTLSRGELLSFYEFDHVPTNDEISDATGYEIGNQKIGWDGGKVWEWKAV